MPTAPPDPGLLLQPVASRAHVALAVSGGSDSMALLRLAAQWKAASAETPRITVLTVDHGLRAAAAAEARQVADWAQSVELDHVTLTWMSGKPLTGIQAKARAARYGLMRDWCRANDASVLLTAHTLEDQAETVLMRLARTTSLDSLAGIHRLGDFDGLALFRPLLACRREGLRAYLSSLGQGWLEDPSNLDDRFERVRIRKAMPLLAGLGITPEALAGLADTAEQAARGLWTAARDWTDSHAVTHETGHCTLSWHAFAAPAEPVRARVLGLLVAGFGAGALPEPGELNLLLAALDAGPCRRTLGGALVARRRDSLIIGREPGRIDATPRLVPDSGEVLWDGRFEVRAEPGSHVIPVACAGTMARRSDLPAFVQAALPAVLGAEGALAVPHLGIGRGASAMFRAGLRR